MTLNWVSRRLDTDYIIADDPWTVTVYRRGASPDDDETSFTFTGRIQPVGARGTQRAQTSAQLAGEAPLGAYSWLLLSTYDTTKLLSGDEVRAIQKGTTVERVFVATFSAMYNYKQETVLDERQ